MCIKKLQFNNEAVAEIAHLILNRSDVLSIQLGSAVVYKATRNNINFLAYIMQRLKGFDCMPSEYDINAITNKFNL